MITYNYDMEFAWNHIQKPRIPKMSLAYDTTFDLTLYLCKDSEGIFIALDDDCDILYKEYVFDLADLKSTFDKYIIIMRERI